MIVTIRQGDITEDDSDAVVNAADTSLRMGGGVAGALKRVGGDRIEEEALRQAPVELGSAVLTGAHRLKAKYVIHAAAMPHYGNRMATEDSIRCAIKSSLLRAEEVKAKSIAFPALGCEVAGFPSGRARG